MNEDSNPLSEEFRYVSGPNEGMTKAEAMVEYKRRIQEYNGNSSGFFRKPKKGEMLRRIANALSGSPGYKYD